MIFVHVEVEKNIKNVVVQKKKQQRHQTKNESMMIFYKKGNLS